jgi:hypothetical protein
VPVEQEADAQSEDDSDTDDTCTDSEADELDVSRTRVFGTRRSERAGKPAQHYGYRVNSSAILMTSDSDQ